MNFISLLSLSLGAILAENIVFTHFFGISLFLEKSGDVKSAAKTGVSVTVTLVFAGILSYLADAFVIKPLGIEYMRTFILILVVVSAVFGAEAVLRAKNPKLSEKLGISLSTVTCNSAILGVMLLNSQKSFGFVSTVTVSLFSGIGFLAVITLFAAVRERLKYSDIPKALQGVPILLIVAGLIALAFTGFQGMKLG